MSKDPIRFDGGLNLYAYVGGDPVNYIDPEGEVAGAIAIGVGAAIATAYAGAVIWANSPAGQDAINDLAQSMCRAADWFMGDKTPDEICRLVADLEWFCIYECPLSGEIETVRHPFDQIPPANDVCPRTITLTD